MAMSWLFNSKPIGYGDTPEKYLKLTKKCMVRAQKLTSTNLSTSPKFNYGQCKYLVEKLNLAVKNGDSLLKLLNSLNKHCSLSLELRTNWLKIFELLHALSMEILNFIQSCCNDSWMQVALTLTNVSERISSIGFDLKLWTLITNDTKALRERRCLTLIEVDDIFKSEVQIVKEIASLDREMMLEKLNALLQTKKPTSSEYQLAALLLERLERSRMISVGDLSRSSQPTLCEVPVKSLKQLESLGKGSAATVYRAKWLGAEVAKKTFYLPSFPDFEKEVSILVELSHPNITCLLCYAEDERECSIVTELMDEDLFSLIQRRLQSQKTRGFPFGILEGVDIMLQIASGMYYLHEMKIVHRDLKSMNILVRCVKASRSEIEHVLAKVADFGLSRTKERSMTYSFQTLNLGTTRWMAPELMRIETDESETGMSNCEATIVKFPFKSDVYSFAMVFYEILTGHQPFASTSSPNEVKKMVLNGDRPQLPNQCPALLKALIERCWSQDATQRPSFGDICTELRHFKCALLFHEAQVSYLPTRQEQEQPMRQVEPLDKASSTPQGSESRPQESTFLKTSRSASPLCGSNHSHATLRAWKPAPLMIPPLDSSTSSSISSSPRSIVQTLRSSMESVLSGSSSLHSGNTSMYNSWQGDGAPVWPPQHYKDRFPSPSPSSSSRLRSLGSSGTTSASVSPLHPQAGGRTGGRPKSPKPVPLPLPIPPLPMGNSSLCNSPPVISERSTPTTLSSHSSSNGMECYVSVESPQSGTPTKWQKWKLLGSGTFGNVYVGFNNDNGSFCAMKEVLLVSDDDMSKESVKQLGQEISLLSKLRHENIVQYISTEMLEDRLYIYLEYASGGSIHKLLQDYGPFKEPVIRKYTRQILSGLDYLHSQNTVHRDIKGANILVDTKGMVKLADFGMAKQISAQSYLWSFKGSPYWMAPEVIKQTGNYDLAVDIWSLGCTVLEMATTKPPWHQYEAVAVIMYKIINSKELPIIPETLSREGRDFVLLCLQRDPAHRPTAAQLLEHPFVQDCRQDDAHVGADLLSNTTLAIRPGNVGHYSKSLPSQVHRVYSGTSSPMMSSGSSTPPSGDYGSSSSLPNQVLSAISAYPNERYGNNDSTTLSGRYANPFMMNGGEVCPESLKDFNWSTPPQHRTREGSPRRQKS